MEFPAGQLPKISRPNNLDDILDSFHRYILATFNCHRVGIIESFDPLTQRAVVQLVEVLRKETHQGQELIIPAPLIDCPVFVNYGVMGGFHFPITKGLECMVSFNDKDLDKWKDTGGVNPPSTYRMHNITDGLCHIGIKSKSKVVDYDNDTVGMKYTDGAKININQKVEISNQTRSLKVLIENLITILQNLQVVDPVSGNLSISPTTSSDLSNLLTNFNELLK